MLHSSWKDAAGDLFAIRIQSTDLDGLTVPPVQGAYMVQYRNNLIGKHFKTLMQTMAFHLHDTDDVQMSTTPQFRLVKAVGALGAVLWVHEIDDMEEYLVCIPYLIPYAPSSVPE